MFMQKCRNCIVTTVDKEKKTAVLIGKPDIDCVTYDINFSGIIKNRYRFDKKKIFKENLYCPTTIVNFQVQSFRNY